MRTQRMSFKLRSLLNYLTVLALFSLQSFVAMAKESVPLKAATVPLTKSPSISKVHGLNKSNETPSSFLGKISQQQRIDRLSEGSAFRMGTKDGGGGDNIALEFQDAARGALRYLEQNFPEIFQELLSQDVETLIETAKVFVVDEALDVENKKFIQSSVAFNSPKSQTIYINRLKWVEILNENIKKAIALHEVLSLKNIESTGRYPISTKLYSKLSLDHTVRRNDLGNVPQEAYICKTSSENMIGIGVEYQVSLSPQLSQVIYSQYSMGNVLPQPYHFEIGRTRRNFPAMINNQGSQYYIQARYYNSEDNEFRDEDLILNPQNLTLNVILVDGRLLPVPCKLISKY